MGKLFVNPTAGSGWLPDKKDMEACEQLLEEGTNSKAVFLPVGCRAECMQIGEGYYFIIEQDPSSSTVTANQQKEIVEKIDKKLGGKAIFLPPGCTLSYFE